MVDIGNAVKEARSHAAQEIADRLEKSYLQNLVGTEQAVLWEQVEDGYFAGHAPNMAKVYCKGENLQNKVLSCPITELFRDGVLAELPHEI